MTEAPVREVYDNTLLQSITYCERFYYYRYISRLRPKDGSPPLRAGSAGHSALEVIYRDGFDQVERAVGKIHEEYTLRPLGFWEFLTPAHLEIIVRNYVDFYRDREPFRVLSLIEEPIISEDLLSFPFGGIPDLIVEDDSEPTIVDHKFTAGWFGHKKTEAEYRKQGRLYVALARDQLGFEGNRAVFNFISMKEKAAEDGFTGQRFERVGFDYEDFEIKEALWWAEGAKRRIEILREENRQELQWLQNGGRWCKYCDFSDLCSAKNERLRESVRRTKLEVGSEPTGTLLSGADS